MTDWVLRLIDAGGYWGIFLLMILENVFPPIPSELIMGIGGIRVGQGRMAMEWLLLAGTLGTTIGNYFWYLVGHILGFGRLKPLVDRFGRWATLEWRDVEALDRAFAQAAASDDFGAALGFLMDWPAHREAAAMVLERRREAQRPWPRKAEWAARLLQRYPEAAEALGG